MDKISNPALPRYLTPASDAARALGMSPKTFANLLSDGRPPLPTFKHGRTNVVKVSDLEALVEKITSTPYVPTVTYKSPKHKPHEANPPRVPPVVKQADQTPAVETRGRPPKKESIEAERRGITVRELRAKTVIGGV